MKSLHLTNSWHANSGGIATFYRSLMEAANRRGHSMTLVIPGEADDLENVGAYGRIYRVRSGRAPVNREYRLMRPNSYLTRNSRLRGIVRTEQPDLVEVCDKYTLNYFAGMLRTGIAGDIGRRPLVVGLSCERMDDNVRAYFGWNGVASTFVRFYMKWLYFSLFDHHIANSHYTADELRPASCGHPVQRGVWIRPMGVDCRELSPALRTSSARSKLAHRINAGENAKLLLYVGRLVPEKNLQLLIDTLAQLNAESEIDWRLVVVGDGIGREAFLSQGEKRTPSRIAWLGHIRNRTELAAVYANCDFFIHPNPHEPFGIAPLEAMASGIPLIAPDRGGILSYANSSNAWIAQPSAPAFAQAIREAACATALRARRLANALLTAQQFRWENVADLFLDLYGSMVRTRTTDFCECRPDFASSPPDGRSSRMARATAFLLQHLLATRES